MVNEKSLENLRNIREMTTEEHKLMSSKGGLRSADAKRKKRELEYLITEKLNAALFKADASERTNLEAIFDKVVTGILSKEDKTSINSFKQLITLFKIIGIGKTYKYSDYECNTVAKPPYSDRWEDK